MKKFTKIAIISAVILFAVGVGCWIAAIATGMDWNHMRDMVENGGLNVTWGDNTFGIEMDFDAFDEDNQTVADETTEQVKGSFRELEIEVGMGEVEVAYADVEETKIEFDGAGKYNRSVRENALRITGKKVGKMKVLLPYSMVLEEIDVEVGAGTVRLQGLDVKELNIEVGAGKVYASLIGTEQDYNYEAEVGTGKMVIGQTSLEGFGGEKEFRNPGATRHMDLECGAGEIEIEFAKEKE